MIVIVPDQNNPKFSFVLGVYKGLDLVHTRIQPNWLLLHDGVIPYVYFFPIAWNPVKFGPKETKGFEVDREDGRSFPTHWGGVKTSQFGL